MTRSNFRSLAVRLVGMTLAFAMLVSPALAQVITAEACRTRCDRMGEVATSACCCKDATAGSPESLALNHPDTQVPTDRGSDAGATFCPGCNGRPLIAGNERIDLSLDSTPVLVASIPPLTIPSADVSLSIFHPPRA